MDEECEEWSLFVECQRNVKNSYMRCTHSKPREQIQKFKMAFACKTMLAPCSSLSPQIRPLPGVCVPDGEAVKRIWFLTPWGSNASELSSQYFFLHSLFSISDLFLWFLPPEVISKTLCFFGVSQAKAFHGAKRTSNSSSWLKSTWAGSSQASWITHFVSMSSSKYKNWNLQYRHFLVIYPTSWQQERELPGPAGLSGTHHHMYCQSIPFVWYCSLTLDACASSFFSWFFMLSLIQCVCFDP